jgi:hypothetical protein
MANATSKKVTNLKRKCKKILASITPNRLSIANLGFKNRIRKLLFSKETYFLASIWTLTWFSYWIIIKNKVDSINITGAAASASFIVLLRLFSNREAVSKALKFFTPPAGKNIHMTHMHLRSHSSKKTQNLPTKYAVQTASQQLFENNPQGAAPKTQKQGPEPAHPVDKPQPFPSTSNGCPKNLDYYAKKPRPKQTPEECYTCQNLIACVTSAND